MLEAWTGRADPARGARNRASAVESNQRDCALRLAAVDREDAVSIAVRLEPAAELPGAVEYRWDPDTDILSANLGESLAGTGTGSIEIEGRDGSWLVLDLAAGRIHG